MSAVHSTATFGECTGYEDIDKASYWNFSDYTDAYNLFFKKQSVHVNKYCMLLISVNKALSFILLSENEIEMISITLVPVYQNTQHHILGDSNLKYTMSIAA
jgi:hypothetical protein